MLNIFASSMVVIAAKQALQRFKYRMASKANIRLRFITGSGNKLQIQGAGYTMDSLSQGQILVPIHFLYV